MARLKHELPGGVAETTEGEIRPLADYVDGDGSPIEVPDRVEGPSLEEITAEARARRKAEQDDWDQRYEKLVDYFDQSAPSTAEARQRALNKLEPRPADYPDVPTPPTFVSHAAFHAAQLRERTEKLDAMDPEERTLFLARERAKREKDARGY